MPVERKIGIFCPAEKITQQDQAEFVDTVLEDERTEVIILSESQFDSVGGLLGTKTSEFGAYWVSYEEDWIEGHENLKGFSKTILDLVKSNQDIECKDLLTKIAELADKAAHQGVPLIICT